MGLTVSNVTTANSTTSSATLAVTGVTASIGDMLILAVAADNAGTAGAASLSTSVTDSKGNTWDNRGGIVNQTAGGAANDGTTLSIWTCLVTIALSSDTVTCNFAPNTASTCATLKKASPAAGEQAQVYSVGVGFHGFGTSHGTGTIAAVPNGYTLFGYSSQQQTGPASSDSDTTNGSWSVAQTVAANTGTGSTSQALSGQHKTVTATGDQDYGPSSGGSLQYASNWLILYSSGTVTAVGTAAGVGAAAAVGAATAVAVGSASGIGAAAGVGRSIALAVGTAHGAGAAAGVGRALWTAVGSASGIGAAFGIMDAAVPTTGIDWLDTLPRPTIAGYALKPASTVTRTDMDWGAARVRRRSTRPLVEVQVQWTWSGSRQALFEAWERTVAQEGGTWFDILLLFPAGLARITARIKAGTDIAQQPLGRDVWQVTATLEVLQRPLMGNDALTSVLGDAGQDPAWPSNRTILPLPVYADYALTDHAAVIRTGDDLRGAAEQRRRSRATITQIPARFELSQAQAATFDGFFVHRAGGGTRWFPMPVFGGIGLVNAEARFTGDVTWSPRAADSWTVQAPLEVRERPILTTAEFADLEVLDDPATAELFDLAGELHGIIEGDDHSDQDLFAEISALHDIIDTGLWSE